MVVIIMSSNAALHELTFAERSYKDRVRSFTCLITTVIVNSLKNSPIKFLVMNTTNCGCFVKVIVTLRMINGVI